MADAVPLISSHRHTNEDLEAWRRFEEQAHVHSRLARFRRRVDEARSAILRFADAGTCYAGTSWGKDSTVLAHLIYQHVRSVPVVWVRVNEDHNPDCALVRDAFLARHAIDYRELPFPLARVEGAEYLSVAAREAGLGSRYLSGVRADESAARRKRVARWGESTAATCAPIARWLGLDVFAYLAHYDLPIHPAYACSFGGLLDPTRLRVSALGGPRGQRIGDGMGRLEWEQRYYGRELAALARILNALSKST